MPKVFYKEKGKEIYVKKVDYSKCELEFTKDSYEAYEFRSGYYSTHVVPFLQKHFIKKYPQVAKFEIDSAW